MKPREAISQSHEILIRHPWLPLIPLCWEVLLLGLRYLGLPLVWPYAGVQLGPGSPSSTIRGYIPSLLPTIADLQLTIAPAIHLASLPPLWVLIIPLAEALLEGLFLGWLVAAATGESLSLRGGWRRAWAAFPGLLTFYLLRWGLPVIVPHDAAILLLPLFFFLSLVPLVITTQGRPFYQALIWAPALLGQHWRAWFGLGWRTLAITAILDLVLKLGGAPTELALFFYPWVATLLVGAAVVLTLGLNDQAVAPIAWSPRWSWLTVPLVMLLAWWGTGWMRAWQGWAPSRTAAVALTVNSVRQIRHVAQLPGGELVLYYAGQSDIQPQAAFLERSRFGWRTVSEIYMADWLTTGPVALQTVSPAVAVDGDPRIPWALMGEVLDERVTTLVVGDQHYPVGRDGPLFVIPLPDGTQFADPYKEIRWLDSQGEPVPPREVKQP